VGVNDGRRVRDTVEWVGSGFQKGLRLLRVAGSGKGVLEAEGCRERNSYSGCGPFGGG